ncbi:MAG: hypothetical protein WCG27_10575, partial [Pseudomonadota bacterium]
MGKKKNRRSTGNTSFFNKPAAPVEPVAATLPIRPSSFDYLPTFVFFSLALAVILSLLAFDTHTYNSFPIPKLFYFVGLTTVAFVAWGTRQLIRPFDSSWIQKGHLFALPIILYIIASALSTYLSTDPILSVFGVYTRYHGLMAFLSSVVLYFVLSATLQHKGDLYTFFYLLIATGLIMGIYSCLQFFGQDPWGWVRTPYLNVPSTSGNSNLNANILSLLLPFGLYFSFFGRKEMRWFSAICSLFILLGVFFARSRAVWLTLLVVGCLAILLMIRLWKE